MSDWRMVDRFVFCYSNDGLFCFPLRKMEARRTMNSAMASEPSENQQRFFRCPIPEPEGSAVIRIGSRRLKTIVQDTSIDGFTVTIAPKFAKRIQVGGHWVLDYQGAQTEVHPQWFYQSPEGQIQLGLRRLRDLTKPPPIRSGWRLWNPSKPADHSGNATIFFGGFVLALIAILSSTRLGEQLGTAKKIESAFKWVVQEVDDQVSRWKT